MNEDATLALLSVLRVALGDNESLNSTLRILTAEPDEVLVGEDTGAMSSSHHYGTRSSGAQAQEARNSTLELVTHCDVVNRPTHTRGLGDSGSDILPIQVIAMMAT